METKQVSIGCSDYIGVQEFIPAWCRASSAPLDLGLASLLKGCVLQWAVQWDWLRRLKSTNGSTGFFHTGRQRKLDLLTRRKIIQTNSSGTHLGWFPGQLACSDECSSLASAGQERNQRQVLPGHVGECGRSRKWWQESGSWRWGRKTWWVAGLLSQMCPYSQSMTLKKPLGYLGKQRVEQIIFVASCIRHPMKEIVENQSIIIGSHTCSC